MLILSLVLPCRADLPSFKQTLPLLQQAIIDKDLPTLQKHIDLYGIVLGKIRKLARQAGEQPGLRYKILSKGVGLTEPALAKMVSEIVLKEFRVSPRAVRRSYLNRLKIAVSGEQDELGYVHGAFLDKPFYLSAVKSRGRWVIIGAESAVLDAELDHLMEAFGRSKQ